MNGMRKLTGAAVVIIVLLAGTSMRGQVTPRRSLALLHAGFDSGTAVQSVAFPPRNEPFSFRLQLESAYQNQLHRTPVSTYVDVEGAIVWTQEYLRYRLSGCGHPQTVQYVLAEVGGATGAPDCGSAVAFPPRNEPFDFRANGLENMYRNLLGRQPVQTFVDIEGDIVWTTEYLRYRVAGCTHDAAQLLVFGQIGGAPPSSGCTTGDRLTIDLPDDTGNYQVKVMYVVPSDGQDERLDVNGTLAISVEAFERWLERESGGLRIRLDTCQGRLDIGFVRLQPSDAQLAVTGAFVRDQIEMLLPQAGFNSNRKIYAVYYGGSSTFSCGGGAWPPALVGRVAAIYLRGAPPGAPPCATNRFATSPDAPAYFEFAMLHEIFHNLGVVPTCAPNQTMAGHVSDDPTDLMYAGPLAWRPSRLDVNRDDYFKHGRNCLDVANSAFMNAASPNAQVPPGWR